MTRQEAEQEAKRRWGSLGYVSGGEGWPCKVGYYLTDAHKNSRSIFAEGRTWRSAFQNFDADRKAGAK